MIARLKQSQLLINFIILGTLILVFTGCSDIKNIRIDASTPEYKPTLVVMTFNIRHGCGREKWGDTSKDFLKGCTKKYGDIIAAIRSADPDVVGIQEVNSDQAGLIAKALNMNYVYSSHNTSGYGSWWGNAVLSRFKIKESQRIAIGGSEGLNRSMVSATVRVNDISVAFVSIHTDHRLPDERSIKKILEYVDSVAIPTILVGDFNMGPGTPRANSLVTGTGIIDSAGLPGYGEMGTWGSPSGERIDYVFVQSKYFRVLDAALVAAEHQHASDHVAYYTTLKYKEPKGAE